MGLSEKKESSFSFVRRTVPLTGIFLVMTLLGGCAAYTQIPPPQLAYDDKAIAHAGTAVIMKDPAADGVVVTIKAVNGRPMSCFMQGCPLWVRVLPGPTKITVDVLYAPSLSVSYRGDFELAVDVQPLHTYLIDYRLDTKSSTIDAGIVDVGVDYKGAFMVRGKAFSPSFD